MSSQRTDSNAASEAAELDAGPDNFLALLADVRAKHFTSNVPPTLAAGTQSTTSKDHSSPACSEAESTPDPELRAFLRELDYLPTVPKEVKVEI
jgi:hypothetical protein